MIRFNLKSMSLLGAAAFALALAAQADDNAPLPSTPDPKLGYELLLSKPMAGKIMKTADLDRLWQIWEPEEKAKAEVATPEERRKMAFARYGWAERPNDKSGLPLDYTEDGHGNLVTNCFSCHGGSFAGKTMPGGGNQHVDMTALATDVQKLKLLDAGRDPSTIKDIKLPFGAPLNYTRGETNAVIFAPVLAAMRDHDMNIVPMRNPGPLDHHDMNAPAWWNVKHKQKLYMDGFAPKSVRQIMPFAMSPTISGEELRGFEPAFVHILAYIENLESPVYPYSVDKKLAAKGREAFELSCARCHGVHGDRANQKDYKWPAKAVPLKEIGTDPIRFGAIKKEHRIEANAGYFQYYGKDPVDLESVGYMAPPLWGVWATAPYFHNGAVPTIEHVFNAAKRPKVWKNIDESAFDEKRIGLKVEELDAVPEGLNGRQQRYYYDTTMASHSKEGHTFPDTELNADEKIAVAEYLKTL